MGCVRGQGQGRCPKALNGFTFQHWEVGILFTENLIYIRGLHYSDKFEHVSKTLHKHPEKSPDKSFRPRENKNGAAIYQLKFNIIHFVSGMEAQWHAFPYLRRRR